MQFDADPQEDRFRQHWLGAREGVTSASASPAEAAAAIEACGGPRARARLRQSWSCLVARAGRRAPTTTSACAASTTARPRRASSSRWSSVERDSESGVDVGAHFLVDAITSASIAAGTSRRQRVHRGAQRGRAARAQALGAQRLSRWRTSTAPSRTTGRTASAPRTARALWDDTATLRVSPRAQLRHHVRRRGRTPDCRPVPGGRLCSLDVWFGGVSLLAGAVARSRSPR